MCCICGGGSTNLCYSGFTYSLKAMKDGSIIDSSIFQFNESNIGNIVAYTADFSSAGSYTVTVTALNEIRKIEGSFQIEIKLCEESELTEFKSFFEEYTY